MTASNHVVAGALIASFIAQPMVAIPIAFISHFIMDALPHYGDTNKHSWLNQRFKYVLASDIILSLCFLAGLALFQPNNWELYAIAGVIATSPDLLWLPYFLADLKHEHRPESSIAKVLKWIQWGERPWGIYLEAIVLVTMLSIFITRV